MITTFGLDVSEAYVDGDGFKHRRRLEHICQAAVLIFAEYGYESLVIDVFKMLYVTKFS